MKRIFVLLLLLVPALPCRAQNNDLFSKIDHAIQARDKAAYLNLTVPEIREQEEREFSEFLAFDYSRAVVKLAEQEEDKYLLQIFTEGDAEARFESWLIESVEVNGIRMIAKRVSLSTLSGLYSLRMSRNAIPVRDLNFRHQDAEFHFREGNLFLILARGEIAGAVFLGNGTLSFAPQEPTEQQQLALFCKQPKLQTGIKAAYFRGDATELKSLFADALAVAGSVKENLYSKARDFEKKSDQNIYGVTVPLSEQLWFPRLQNKELYCEMNTTHGLLAYQFYPGQTDDVVLVQKERNQIISLYSSHGIYSVPFQEDYHVLSYRLRVTYQPEKLYLSGIAAVRIRSRQETDSLVFLLNPDLRVTKIRTNQGTPLYFQERKSKNLHMILNRSLGKDEDLSLEFEYQGRIEPEKGRSESVEITGNREKDFYISPTYLYSNQANWYPQLESKPYSPLQATFWVPAQYTAVGNGRLVKEETKSGQTAYSYDSAIPLKYFSMFVSRLNGRLHYESLVPIDVFFHSIDDATARETAKSADRILRFYSGRFGKFPYQNLNLVLRPMEEPGGHAPPTVAILNRVFSYWEVKMIRDPVHITEFPDIFLAHELAHQWWGQAIGWQGYRDQWLSEGFAQFAAATYVRSEYGDDGWLKLSRIFRRWIQEKTNSGPVILASRLGHLNQDPQSYSAILYNKGAYVVNMLRIWMGDEKFYKFLDNFYHYNEFKRVSVSDFQKMAQEYSLEDLDPFFNQWLYRWDIPAVTWTHTVEGNTVRLRFVQPEQTFFRLKIPVVAKGKDGAVHQSLVYVDKPVTEVTLDIPFVPTQVDVDPLNENLATYKES